MNLKLYKKLKSKYIIVRRFYDIYKISYGVSFSGNHKLISHAYYYTPEQAHQKRKELILQDISYIRKNGYIKYYLKSLIQKYITWVD